MAEYVKFDDLKYPYARILFRDVYDLPNNLTTEQNRYASLKLRDYKTLTPTEIQEMNDLGDLLYDYSITSADYMRCFNCLGDVQNFIIDYLPNYMNDCLTEVWNQVNLGIKDVNDLKDDISTWWSSVKLSVALNSKTFSWDNWLVLPNVDYYSTQINSNKIVETLMFKDTSFGTYTTVFNTNSITETIVITDPFDNTTLYNKTKTTVFNSDGTIKESITNN